MLSKIVALFLVGMMILGMLGRLKVNWPKRPKIAARCPECGRHKIGKGPCPCGAKG